MTPKEARVMRIYLFLALLFLAGSVSSAFADAAFQTFLQSLWPQAQAVGVSRATFDQATRGLEPDLSLPDLTIPGRPERAPGQAEFVQTPADYLKEPAIQRLATQLHGSRANHDCQRGRSPGRHLCAGCDAL